MVVFNIIVVSALIFIGSNLDNCDKFKVPKYDKNDVFDSKRDWIVFLTPFMYVFENYIR